jgi:hypothetical protein
MLCLNKRNKKDLICKWKICEYFEPLLILLYKKVNIVVKESYSQLDQDNDQIKMDYIYDCQNDEYRVDLFDFTKHIVIINFIYKFYEIEKFSFPWRYTSLCCSYSSLEILSDFVCCLWNLIQFKMKSGFLGETLEKFVYFQCVDLMKEIINSFDILQKMLEIPKIIFIIKEFREQLPFLFLYSILMVGTFICVYCDDETILIILSLLDISMKYVKSKLFFCFPSDLKTQIYDDICVIMHDIVFSLIKSPNKYPDLIRSYFEKSGWTELLIHIFNALNVLLSSSHSHSDIPPSLSFFSSVSPSKDTAYIVDSTAKTIKMLLNSNTPKTVVEYLELTLFI